MNNACMPKYLILAAQILMASLFPCAFSCAKPANVSSRTVEVKRYKTQRRSNIITKDLLLETMEYQRKRVEKKHGRGIVPPGIEALPDLPFGVEYITVKQVGVPIPTNQDKSGDSSIITPV
jgi:hypothetical protein